MGRLCIVGFRSARFLQPAAIFAWAACCCLGAVAVSNTWAQEPAPQEQQAANEKPDGTGASKQADLAYALLKSRCFSCHGSEVVEGGLRLDREEDFRNGGDHGPLLEVSEGGSESLLVQVLSGRHEELERMPPEGEGTPFSQDEINQIRDWLAAGAVFPSKVSSGVESPAIWSLQPLTRFPEVPMIDGDWPRNPIDQFVGSRLQRVGVVPAVRADRSTLARRLYLDLLGLLPPPELVKSFVGDSDPAAYEKLVDHVLSSPHFGERWGRHWLDAARYADSDGYEKDRPRPLAWRYREWVIDAINRDLSYRDFSIQQIAGDLIPDASSNVVAATGFHRNTLHNTEGGTDQEEDRVKKTVDRTNTVGTLWLGLTVGCAQCHSHKYDPLTQREYFQLYAFFNQIEERNAKAMLDRDGVDLQFQLKKWDQERRELEEVKNVAEQGLQQRFDRWLATKPSFPLWSSWNRAKIAALHGTEFKDLEDGSWLATGANQASEVYTVVGEPPADRTWSALRLEVLPHASLPKQGPGRADNGNFVLTDFTLEVLDADGGTQAVEFKKVHADFSQKDWLVAKSINGDGEDGWAISPAVGLRHAAIYEFSEPISLPPGGQLQVTLKQRYSGKSHNLGRFRITLTDSKDFFPADDLDPELAAKLESSESGLDAEILTSLMRYYRGWDRDFQEFQVRWEALLARRPQEQGLDVQAVVERAKPRDTRVHLRGDFLRPGAVVNARVPRVFPTLEIQEGIPNRLDFAEWLFQPGHPTTARTEVNRIWLRLFGNGLVRTPDDFGTQGGPPTHPELLAWLAFEFQSQGWSRKQLIRTIVLSETYQQSSAVRPELWNRDPENEWLGRQNRMRLEAEIIRDISLDASGLLDPRVGGPSVRPPQPEGYSALTYANSAKWESSQGGDANRRGIYTFFQRTSPYPMLMTFDCPDANQAVVARNSSNTPLQALTLWNERVFFDCHRAMAQRLFKEVPYAGPESLDSDFEERLNWAAAIGLGRSLTPSEFQTFKHLYREVRSQLEPWAADSARLQELVGLDWKGIPGEADPSKQTLDYATWILLCRTLMNLDEFISRE
jgi:cytochrome c5